MIRHSGIGTYIRGLVSEYPRHPFFSEHSLGVAVPRSLFSEVDGTVRANAFHSPVYSLQEQVEYPFRLGRCRLWHTPHYNFPLIKNKTRLVVTIHDLIHWIFRKEFYSALQASYAEFFFRSLVRSADRIIAVSERTQEDLVEYFKVPRERIRVVYEGVAEEFFQVPREEERKRVLEKYKLPDRFFLYVGLIKPHKNVKRLVEVFSRLREERRVESALVLIGRRDKNYQKESESLMNLERVPGVHYISQLESRRELTCVYASARALVHPSLYEGFGLTCLEAMAVGTPVVVSKVASLPEVVGEAGYYVDPHSEDSVREALLAVERDDSLRAELGRKGRARARGFSWPKAAQETIEVYQEVLNSSF